MNVITDVNKLAVKGSSIYYEDQKIGKWWARTLFYFDPKNKTLQYENFSLFGLMLHICGYKKKFNDQGLKDWLISKNINLKPLSPDGRVTKKVVFQALQALQDKKKQFVSICLYGVKALDGKSPEEATTHALIQLFKDGLDINATIDDCNTSVLQAACCRKRFEVAKYLIEQGAKINTMTTEGSGYVAKTPLQHAIQNRYDPLILLLLEKGADVNTRNYNKETILHMALSNLKEESAESNPKKIIQELLAKNAKVNEADARGATCLYKACEMGELDVIQWLVAKTADVNGFGKYGKPPLFAAVFQGNVEVVRFLLDNGANPKPQEPQPENNWETPLSIAVWKPNSEMIKLLHAKGADINQKNNSYQDAPLHIAARQGDLETVKLLIELGADPVIKNRDKTTAELARAKGYEEMAVYLEGLPKSNL
jgi:ankyrin repeat protein